MGWWKINIIGAFDRSRVAELEPRVNSVLISITSQESEHPKVDGKWKDILKLKFDDVEGREKDIGDAMNTISEKQAKNILDFVINHIDCDFFVNCDAGISRSTGVVVALELIFNSRDVSNNYPYHNRFVKNKIRDVWFKTIWEERKKWII